MPPAAILGRYFLVVTVLRKAKVATGAYNCAHAAIAIETAMPLATYFFSSTVVLVFVAAFLNLSTKILKVLKA